MSEQGKLATLVQQLKHGEVDRRGFMKAATVLGVAPAVSMFLANAAAAGSSRNGFAFYSQSTPDASAEASPVASSGIPETGMEGKTRGQDGELKILQWQAPTHLMSHRATGTKDFMAADMVNEPLMRYAEDGSLTANLLTEVPSVENGMLAEDLTTCTLKLQEGVLWSDGEALTANDVAFTWKWVTTTANNSVTIGLWETIENIEVQDDTTALVTFKQPSAAWFDPFTGGNNGHIYPAHYWADDPTDEEKSDAFQLMPIGTGPFVVESFSPNDSARYVANENYRHENKPAFASIDLKGGGDAPAAARSVLQTGEYHYAWNLQVEPDVLEAMMEEEGPGQLIIEAGTSLERIHVNFSDPNKEVDGQKSEKNTPHPWLGDMAVREALNASIDRELIATTLYGPGQPATANVLNGLAAFASPNTSWVFDADAANAMLDEAGYTLNDDGVREKDGLKLEGVYATSVNPVRQKTQAVVKANWAKIGVEVSLEQVDAGIFFDSGEGNDQNINHMYWDLNMYTNNATSSVPIAYMEDWYAGEDGNNIAQASNGWTGTNRQRWANDDYDAAYEALLKATSLEEAGELLITMNDIIIADRAVIPLVNRAADVYAISKTMYQENVALGVGFEYNYWNIANWNLKPE